MARSQDSTFKVKHVMDPKLWNFIYKKSRARNEIDQDLNHMVCLLEAELDLQDMPQKYVEKVQRFTARGKEEVDFFVREHGGYLRKVKEGVCDILLFFLLI